MSGLNRSAAHRLVVCRLCLRSLRSVQSGSDADTRVGRSTAGDRPYPRTDTNGSPSQLSAQLVGEKTIRSRSPFFHLYARLGSFSLVVLVTRTYCAVSVRTHIRPRTRASHHTASHRAAPYRAVPYHIIYHTLSCA